MRKKRKTKKEYGEEDIKMRKQKNGRVDERKCKRDGVCVNM